jgi:hypothetical protein
MGLNSCEQYTITWTHIPLSSKLFFDEMIAEWQTRPGRLVSMCEE